MLMGEQYREIVVLNNQGVVLVENARHGDARNYFERALMLITRSVNLSYEKMHTNATPHHKHLYPRVRHVWSCASSSETTERIDSTSATYVYRRALFIDCSDIPLSDYREEATIIVYNLALSLHLVGLDRKLSMIPTAIWLYQIACRMLAGEFQNLEFSRGSLLRDPMFRAAIISNMGSASFELSDFQSGSYYFGELVHELCNSQLPKGARSTPFAKDVQGFLINSALEIPTTAPSA